MKDFYMLFQLSLVLLHAHCYVASTTPHSGSFQGGWIDPDTHVHDYTIQSFKSPYGNEKKKLHLVMSDEFEVEGREFQDGADPMWTAMEKSDDDQTSGGKKSLQFYSSSMVSTRGGKLVIRSTTENTHWREFDPFKKKYDSMRRTFMSGMIQGWDKFCFTGGAVEVRLKFPGKHDVSGLWPAAWLLGNLGRATYEASTNKMWPWSYSPCDRGGQQAQEVSGCAVTEHYGLHRHQGRGATEIDIVEAMSGPASELPSVQHDVRRPYSALTLQMAPGVSSTRQRPTPGYLPSSLKGDVWYSNLTYGPTVSQNPYFYGSYLGPTRKNEPIYRSADEAYQADALGALLPLSEQHWRNFTTFRLEWEPGEQGYLRWYADGKFAFGIDGADLQATTGGSIPTEPSYLIFNTAISNSWGFPTELPEDCSGDYDCKTAAGQCGFPEGFCDIFPTAFEIESVRVYQSKDKGSNHTVGCNPRSHPTAKFIAAHKYRYLAPHETVPKKPVQQGGGRCNVSDANACGASTNASTGHAGSLSDSASTPTEPRQGRGRGYCNWLGVCTCNDPFTGPTCKVPTYRDNSPGWDWEQQDDVLAPVWPEVPPALAVMTSLLAVALTLVVSALRNQRTKDSTGANSAMADADELLLERNSNNGKSNSNGNSHDSGRGDIELTDSHRSYRTSGSGSGSGSGSDRSHH